MKSYFNTCKQVAKYTVAIFDSAGAESPGSRRLARENWLREKYTSFHFLFC